MLLALIFVSAASSRLFQARKLAVDFKEKLDEVEQTLKFAQSLNLFNLVDKFQQKLEKIAKEIQKEMRLAIYAYDDSPNIKTVKSCIERIANIDREMCKEIQVQLRKYLEKVQTEIEQNNVNENDVKQNKVKENDIEQNDDKQNDVEQNNVEHNNVEQNDVKQKEVIGNNIDQNNVEQIIVEQNNVKENDIKENDIKGNNVFGLVELLCMFIFAFLIFIPFLTMYFIKDRETKINTEFLTIKPMKQREERLPTIRFNPTQKSITKMSSTDIVTKETLSIVNTQDQDCQENEAYTERVNVKLVRATFRPSPEHFFQACLYGHKEIVRHLLANHGNELDIQQVEPVTGYTAFHLACAGGHLSVVQQLMAKCGAETCRQLITTDGKSGLILAAVSGRKEIVQTILNTYKKKDIR